jgi:uncharacterized membrane protein (UPF0127 family)
MSEPIKVKQESLFVEWRPAMPGSDPSSPSRRRVPLRGIAHLLTLGTLLACNTSGRQAMGNGEATSSMKEGSPSLQERLPPRGRAWVIFGKDTVLAEVAKTAEQREEGLMYRESLEEGRGMLFVFSDSQIRSFWMRNTLIPLDIAYIDENLRIADIHAMEPQTEDPHPSARPAMFALEVPQGWFAQAGIEVGAQARIVFGPG